ncbi:MAG TPA: tripartite tricarboxylate transporter substrate binding protein [Paralcaligenes sp.]|jgi:Uncharacterized protein conserved in bacteria
MSLTKKALFLSLTVSLLGLGAVAPSYAASYPDRPITLVVPFPPGGGSDSVARGLARGMSERLGVSVVVDNKAGGGTIIGTQHVVRSKPDGYTLFWGSTPTAINPSVYKDLSYDTLKDLTTISDVGQQPLVLVVNSSSPAKTLKDLIDEGKKDPGKLTYGSSGVGGSPHLATALLLHEAGVDAVHVPYKGSAPAVQGVLANQTSFVFDTVILTLPFIKAGRLNALAQTSAKRSPLLPNVPTVAEAGYPGYEITSWYSVLAPAATPKAIITKLNKVINEVLADPKIASTFTAQGFQMAGDTPEQAQEHLKQEIKKWSKAVEYSGVRAN